MLEQVLMGMALLVATTVIHSVATALALTWLRHLQEINWSMHGKVRPTALLAGIVLLFFATSLVEVSLWAMTYVAVGALESLEPALYFSMVTFTTLGYGDVLLTDDWRLFASFQAATGIIVFGWTTAIIVATLQRIIRTAEEAEQS